MFKVTIFTPFLFLFLFLFLFSSVIITFANTIHGTIYLKNPTHYSYRISLPYSIIQIKNLPPKIIYQTYKMASRTNSGKKISKLKNRKSKSKTLKKSNKKRRESKTRKQRTTHSKIASKIKNTTTKTKTTDACSVNSDGLGYTCYSKPVLFKIKDTWNKKHPEQKIVSSDPYIIWKSLRSVMEHEHACKRESCWLKHLCVKEGLPKNIYDLTFSPEMPRSWLKNPNEWLNSLDILRVMNQWERRYKCFKFIGPSPIDYDTHKMFGECVWDELCKFDLKKQIKNKFKKIGVIFNLDPHYKGGSHWVAVFINANKKTIYYFDSYGDRAPSQIKKFIKDVKKQSSELGDSYKYLENKRRHQFGDSECGMYSMYFITEMIQNRCFEKFQNKKVTDGYMLRLRNRFFNKPI